MKDSVTINSRKLAKIAIRGPAAWCIARDHERILFRLSCLKRPYLSLRGAVRVLGVSHHTLLDWEKSGLFCRVRSRAAGVHPKYRVGDLVRFIELLRDKPLAYPSPVARFGRKRTWPFAVLGKSFSWAASEKSLTPCEIAVRIGCHPSTVVRAIVCGEVRGRRRTPKRWEVRRMDWQRAFLFSLENRKFEVDTGFGELPPKSGK